MRRWSVLGRIAVISLAGTLALAARADHHAVKVVSGDKVGSYLADAKGMTLYVFRKDSAGKSACGSECLVKWPLFYREQVGATGDLKASDFGSITREDGQKQTTYKGMPLYYFAGDKAPGDTAGQGAKEVWFAATP